MAPSERSNNSVPSLSAKSNAGDNADVILWGDPATHRLLVDVTISSATVVGAKSNNAVVPGSTNLGVLPAVATAAAPSYTEGFQVGLSTDLAGALRVTGSLSVGGTTDNSAFTAGTSTGTPAMGFYHSTIDAVTDGRAASLAIDAKRNLFVVLRDAAGNARGLNVDANGAVAVTATVASGGIASGAIASGAVASGAFASGSIGSGAIASGAIASGAIASGAVASGAIVAGAVAAGASSFVKLEDVASADADAGVPAMAIQKATPADTAGTDGDYAMLQMSGGRLWVDASGKTLTVASHAITVASGGIASGAIASGAFASGAVGSGAIASGAVASGAFASGSIGSGAIASGAIASGAIAAGAIATGATSIAANEDDASANLDTGVKILFVQQSTPADTAGTNGDYMMPQMSAGRIWTASNIDKINNVTPLMGNGATGTGSQRVTIANDNTGIANWGQGATGAAVPAGAQYTAGIAKTANPAAATDGNLTGVLMDKLGKLVTVSAIRDLKGVQQTQISSSTAETTVVTAVASTFLDVYGVIVTNTSATVTKVTFKDSTAGTTRFVLEVPATETRGFMLDPGGAIPQATVNNNWTATCGTSVAAIEITMLYVKNI